MFPTDNNNNNNYKLFLLVFNNIYIKNHIFGFIKNEIKPKPYNDITLSTISRLSNKIEILADKIKTKTVFKDISRFLLQHLLTCANTNYPNDESVQENIIKFYQINKQQIYHELVQPQWTGDLISILLRSKCNLKLLNLVYSDYLEIKRGCDGDEIKNLKLAQSIIDIGGHDNASKLSILYELALKFGNLDSLKFLHKTLNTSIQQIDKIPMVLEWILYFPNRGELLEFLIEEMNFKFSIDQQIKTTTYFYLNVKYLSFSLFKKVFEDCNDYSKSIEFSKIPFSNQNIKFSKSSISNEIIHGDYLPFRKVLDLIQCSIYISSYLISNYSSNSISNFKYYLEKIELLIKYNNDPTILNKNQLIQFQNDENNDDNNNGISEMVSKLFSIFKSDGPISTNSTIIEYNIPNKTLVNFNQFNLEREIRRIYTFDFLLKDIRKPECYNMISNFVLNFASIYKEHQIIQELIQFQFHGLKENTLTANCFFKAFENADSKLIKFIFKTFKNVENYQAPIIGIMGPIDLIKMNCKIIPIEIQIEFLSTILSYDIYYPFSFKTTLNHIFSNNNSSNLSIENLNKITTIIEQYQFKIQNEKKYSEKQLLFNLYAKQCFINNSNSYQIVNYYQNICKKSYLFKEWEEYYK